MSSIPVLDTTLFTLGATNVVSNATFEMRNLRLKLFFSNKYAYAQIVRLGDGNILAAASTIEKITREGLTGSTVDKQACKRYSQSVNLIVLSRM